VQAQQHLRRSSSMIERVEYRRKRLAAGVANMQSRARRAPCCAAFVTLCRNRALCRHNRVTTYVSRSIVWS
jgi:hypothetical protein